MLIVIPVSFSSTTAMTFPPRGWSLRWYQAYLDDHAWIDATFRSLKIGAATTVLSTVLGTMLAPITGLAVCLNQVVEQMGGAAAPAAEAEAPAAE